MTKLVRWWRNLTCRHQHIWVKATTGVEAADQQWHGNAAIGVVVRCQKCDQSWAADVYAAIDHNALSHLYRPQPKGNMFRYCPAVDHPMSPEYCQLTPHQDCASCSEQLHPAHCADETDHA
jgi:hypothetical protein